MSTVEPAAFYTSIFNTEAYKNQSGYLTIDYANRTYLKLVGGSIYGSLAIGIDLSVAGNINLSGTSSHLYLTGASGGIDLTGNASQINLTGNASHIMLTGTSSHLTLSGNTSNIHLTGTNSTLHLSGTGSHIQIDNLEAGNASGSQGAIKCAGGAYFGNQVYVDANLATQTLALNGIDITSTATEINYLSGITLGTITASKVLTVDWNNNINSILRITCNNSTTGYLTCQQWTNNFNFLGARLYMTSVSAAIGTSTPNAFNIVSNNLNAIECDSSQIVNITSGLKIAGTLITASATQLNYLSGITLGTITASKAITADVSSNINSTLRLKKIANNHQIYFENGTSTGTVYHNLNGTLYFGSISANDIVFQTNNIQRVVITSAGLMDILAGWKISGTTVSASAIELNYNDITTLGTFESSKTMTLNSSGIGLMGSLGNCTSNCLRFYGGTANKEIINVFRDSDDSGLTIATKAQTIQKCSPLLQLYSGYDQSGVIGTSAAEYKEVIRSNHKLVGFTTNYQSGWFHGYLLASQPWGQNEGTQFYTSATAFNIAWDTSNTTSFASTNNLLFNRGQIAFNTLTPQSNFQLTLGVASGRQGIYLNSIGGSAIYVKTQFGGTTGRCSLDFEDNAGNVYEYGIRATGETPNGWYWYVGGHKMCLTRTTGRLGLGTTSPSAKIHAVDTNYLLKLSDGTCDLIAWINTGGILGRQAFFGTDTADALTFQTNNSPRMQIQSNGNITIGNGAGYYPLHILNTVGGDASYNYYYYLGPGSSNGSTTTTPSNVSMKSEGRLLVVGEVDVISDIRTKKDIEILDKDYCVNFVKKINPKKFVYKHEPNGLQFGYIAQDLIKNNFGDLIMVSEDDKMDEYIDEDGFVSEKDKLYTLTRSQVIPILHNAIKELYDKIEKLENELNSLKNI